MTDKHIARRRNIGYAGLSGAYWMLYCVAASYSSVFLLARDYSTAEIGLIVALGYIAGLVLQPVAAALADRGPKAPIWVIALCALCGGLALVALLLIPGHSLAVSVIFVLLLAFVMPLQPLVNAFSFYLERLGTPIYFGACRAMGSLFYAILSIILGTLTVRCGTQSVPVTGLVITALALVLLFILHREGTPPAPVLTPQKGAAQTSGNFVHALRQHPSFLFLLGGTALIFFGHAVVMNFTMQIVANVGGDSEDMGQLCSYIAILELPGMILFDRLRRRFSCTGMLKFAAIFFLVKNVLVLFATSMAGLYIGTFFQALSFSLFTAASVRYAGEQMPVDAQNKAQACITAMITVGNVCASAAGGLIIDRAGVFTGLLVAAIVAGAGMLLMVLGMRREKPQEDALYS